MTEKKPEFFDGNPLTQLARYKLLIVEGEDAIKFLQGQCTCDFTRLNDKNWLLGAHCNVQGRMHSSFYTALLPNGAVGLRVHESIAESALNALKKYIVFSKATIEISDYVIAGLCIAHGDEIFDNNIPLPELGKVSNLEPSSTLLRLDNRRCELWLSSPSQLAGLGCAPLPPNNHYADPWQALNIEAGIAEVCAQSAEKLLPQELNFQLIDGISFKKGCYTGQEIVARMHYKATLKKHLYRGKVKLPEGASTPGYGTEVRLENQTRSSGTIIQCAQTGADTFEFLALVKDDTAFSENAILELASQPKIEWLPLPYAIPKEASE